jgi:hypothetical protein
LVRYVPLASENLADVNISLGVASLTARLQANVAPPCREVRDVNYDGLPESAITFLNVRWEDRAGTSFLVLWMQ